IDPQPLRKRIADITDVLMREEADTARLLAERGAGRKPAPTPLRTGIAAAGANELEATIADLTAQMIAAADELKFELAARLRDEVQELKKDLRAMETAGHVR
ncbi:MAG: UvrB/UvrC motif-containing protein, partial [Microbacteriaceae bacterium]|nr:UvrB/UvrC motif-containing protein [Microbacteriaceae bacterium]